MADDRSDAEADARASRPIPYRQAAGVSVSTDRERSVSRFFLKTTSGALFDFGEHEHFLWRALDGHASFAEIEHAFASRFGSRLTPRDLSTFIAHGVRGGLVEHYGDPSDEFDGDLEFTAAQRSSEPTGQRSDDRAPRPQQARRSSAPVGKEPWTIIVGDPTKLFAFLAALFGPVRYVKWLVIPAAFVAGMTLLKNSSQFQADWGSIITGVAWWPSLFLYEHVLNVVARITEGTIIQAHGGTVRFFGFRFLGVIVRAYIDEHAVKSMPKHVLLWSKAGPLLLRLGIFDLMIFIWIMFRQTHPSEVKVALFVAVISLILMCINACPLVLAEGYELLATALDQPKLAVRAYRLLGIHLGGRSAPATMSAAEQIGLIFFALGTLLVNVIVLLAIFIHMGHYFTSNVQGLGYLLMLCVFIATGLYIYVLTKFIRKADAARRRLADSGRGTESPMG